MFKFCGSFHPDYRPKVTGFNQEGGRFWIGFFDDQDISDGMIAIELKVPSDISPTNNTFASLHVHHDGVKVLHKLEEIGFLKLFQEIQASTFYDIVQCCVRCDIPIVYHGGEYTKEMTNRKIYEILYLDNEKETAS